MLANRPAIATAEAEFFKQNKIEFPTGKFQCIVADPCWQYSLRSDDPTHRNLTPYACMSLDQIKALPIASLADDSGCVLWLWTTNNHVRSAYECLDAWGFQEKGLLTWVKISSKGTPHIGVGHWLRNCTEHVIVATRGKVSSFSHRKFLTNQASVFYAPRGKHSEKPEIFYLEYPDTLCWGMSKLEMFARKERSGYTTWGKIEK